MYPCESLQSTVLACSEPSVSSAAMVIMMPIMNITSNCVLSLAPYTHTCTTVQLLDVQQRTRTHHGRSSKSGS